MIAWLTLALLSAAPAVVTQPQAPLKGTPNKPAQLGWFALPKALSGDPRKIPIGPLELEVKKPQRAQLTNGIQVYLIPDRAVPLINLRLVVPVGSFDDPADKLGLAAITFDMLANGGAGKLDADQLDELLEFHAADAGGGASEELSSVGISLRSDDLQKLLPVFADIALRPRFQKDRFTNLVERSLESVRRRPDSPDGLAFRGIRKALFGPTSVFGRESTEKTLKAITVEDLKSFHARASSPKGARLLVTGDFEPKAMLELLQKELGGGGASNTPPVARVFDTPAPLKRRVIAIPKATPQSKILVGGHGYQRLSPQEYSLRMVTQTLSGMGVGRLYKEVRDARGLAYSAYAMLHSGPTTGMFIAGADTKPEQTTAALEAILRILEETASTKPPTASELSVASDMYLNSFAFRFDSPEKIVSEKATFDTFGFPDDYLDTFRSNIAKVDGPAALAAAKKLMQMDELQIVVVGPLEKIGELSRFGPVTVIKDVEAFK
jgi:zinc protease